MAAGMRPTAVLPAVRDEPTIVAPRPDRPADRRWLAAIAGVAAVALVAAIGIALTRGDGKGATATGPSTTSTTTPPSTTATTAPTTTTTAEPVAIERPGGVPSDWIAYQGDGWSTWHPADWSTAPGPAGSIDLTSPDGDYLRIDTVDQPSADAKAGWEAAEPGFAARHADYQRLRIDDVVYQGRPAAIWEFTFDGQHAADLGFREGNRGYALNLVTGEDRWDDLAEVWQAFQDGFQVG
jgi:hypothetical protein